MMHCPSCGVGVSAGARACPTCGSEVTDPGARTLTIATEELQERDELLAQLTRELASEYEFERELGRGGMAVVYKATEIELRRPVAIKVLPPGVAARSLAERFRREARLAASLDHPAIIPIYRVGQAAGTYYFAMKYVEGRALDAVIEAQGALPLPVILAVLRTAADALAYAHERRVVHRDIKGANILVDLEGRLLVSDFGIARASEDKGLTATGSLMGTPYFMSPEACAGMPIVPQSDQYSLGILAFQMMSGAVPFDSDSLMGLMQHHCYSPVPDVRRVRDGLPEALVTLVERTLAKDPSQRFADTRELVAAIDAVPGSDEQRRAGEELLRQLARGEPIPQVRTASLPPVPPPRLVRGGASGTPAVLQTRVEASRWRPHRWSSLLGRPAAAGVVAAALVVGVGAAVLLSGSKGAGRGSGAASRARVAAAAFAVASGSASGAALSGGERAREPARAVRRERPSAPAPAAVTPRTVVPQALGAQEIAGAPYSVIPTGTLRLYTLPVTASVWVDGRRVAWGVVAGIPIAAGERRLRITSPGYVTFDTVLQVTPEHRLDLGLVELRRTDN